MDILDDMGASKLSANVFFKVNYSFKGTWWASMLPGFHSALCDLLGSEHFSALQYIRSDSYGLLVLRSQSFLSLAKDHPEAICLTCEATNHSLFCSTSCLRAWQCKVDDPIMTACLLLTFGGLESRHLCFQVDRLPDIL